jgi:hypothetical protein
MIKLSQVTAIILFLTIAITVEVNSPSSAIAHSVCGITREAASFKTKSYLITICPGEASFQLILTYHDGTGYKRIPVQKEGNKYRGSDGKNNYIVDRNQLIIGTDGEEPIREVIIESKN